ncbi:Programmed cell death protein 2 [Galdieria sulphuraria]|uniref:Zinc finger (MYND type) family protein / programmed cell death 2 C-terminal domain-containing protein n=1 Tax=Galdieria sulphuraria TaxID=130081 RepID=M2XPT5_GALSU|nr:zinc finger (MYND type) family protein / programmed cell death 2 C-terminal domain-containing protein [Galdieria sulphuraria]EME32227.1 zinc finger (MYND type) family protein / programmed cell death 2 C-terminal domain-containing protein [Galdieria sulphuraria]GJD09649.1 Programmed cell death protein 2 [Galdieria sulphuraria]|eukprot:XP_005708747.1 zinc finger (MYND type) family protein / programmed cell death 2 C-terminal domain-containing protein [Galdieria sulphuraria]
MSHSLEYSSDSISSNENATSLLGLLKAFNEDPRVSSRFAFPCKVGSRPAWLEARNLPNTSALVCGTCSQRLEFLLQIYAPLDREIVGHEEAFHRMLYVFFCVNPDCLKKNDFCKVFRSQLPAENPFYCDQFESNLQLGSQKEFCEAEINTCVVCCLAATSVCGKCRRRYYCSRECQAIDWRWAHKDSCVGDAVSGEDNVLYYYFPPFLLDISEEECEEAPSLNNPTLYNDMTWKDDEDLEETEKDSTRDKIFEYFQSRVCEEPRQVVRYAPREERLEPLWFREEGRILYESDVPPCACCGQPRVYEFQVMPQLLYYLHQALDSTDMKKYSAKVRYVKDHVDFGTIVVYTCRTSCSLRRKMNEESFFSFYAEEYVLVQDAFK